MYCLIMDVCVQANHLKSETETYEEKEQQLVNDCVKELSEPHLHFYLLFRTHFFLYFIVYSVLCFGLMSLFSCPIRVVQSPNLCHSRGIGS